MGGNEMGKWGRWLLVGALVAAATACGGDDDDDDATEGSAASAESAAPSAAPADSAGDDTDATTVAPSTDSAPGTTAGDDAEIDPDGTLRIATFASLLWDPALSPSSYTITYLGLVYDRLVHTAPDGSLVPGLAESWEYSDDGTVLTFDLREGVNFQDGEVFDAEAVKANIERSKTIEGSTVAPELASIAEVVVVDPQTVELHLSTPDATLPAVFCGRAGAMISPAAMDDPQLDHNPVGTGMYELVEFAEGSDFAFEPWDGYWDPDAVKLGRIEVRVLPDTATRVNAVRSGEIDIAPIEPADVATVEEVDGVTVRLNDTLRYVYLAMNTAIEPLGDLRVRQAIMHAIDRESLVNGPFFGYGEPTQQPWPSGYFPHVDGLDDTYPYDPDRARELLTEAGYPDGFSADIIAVPSPEVYLLLGEAVQAQLKEVGIDLSIQITPPTELGTAMYVDKTAAFALLYTNGGVDPAQTVGTRFSAEGFFNAGKYSTPRLEELYQESLTTTDEAARTQVMQDISREVVEQVLDMPLFFAQEPEAISDRVVGYESFFTGRPEFRGVAVTS
jgi:peptide/nickel transport system substrate-binding protein